MSTQLPFYAIFDALRRNGFPLGIDEYKDFIEALCSYGVYTPTENILSRKELLDICRTLWLKPDQVPLLFEKIFDEHYNRIFAPLKEAPVLNERAMENMSENRPQTPSIEVDRGQTLKPDPSLAGTANEDQAIREFALAQITRFRLEFNGGRERQQHFQKEDGMSDERLFLFSDNYFQVSCREVQQLLSSLPERKRRKGKIEIDTDLTIQGIAKNGYLAKIIYEKEENITNHLLILHDHRGSMVAFEGLSAMITKAAKALFGANGQKGTMTGAFYFQNATNEIIYLNKTHTKYLSMEAFTDLFKEKKVMIIIVSDAGAARMSNSTARVKANIRMLRQLARVSDKIAWLNPMPPERWEGSAAARVANFVPMFPVDRWGILQAVEVLKGKRLKVNE